MMTIPGLYGDRLTTYGYLMRPKAQDKPWPAVILLHGGFTADSKDWIFPPRGLALNFIKAGYVVFALDYRGSSGHGDQFNQLDDLGTSSVDDVLSGLKLLQTRPQVDSKRIAVIGASRGAVLALRAAEMTDQIKLVVGYSSVVDYRLFFCKQGCATSAEAKRWCETLSRQEKITMPPAPAPSKFCKNLKGAMGCNPWEPDCRDFTDGSPLLHLEKLRAPVLLHHGEEDNAVSYQDALALDRHLNSLKLTHKLFLYKTKDYGAARHGFFSAATSEHNPAAADVAWKRTMRALDYYLKGKGSKPW